MKVLLIEDDIQTAETTRQVLQMNSHEVRVIYTGKEALEVAKLGRWADVVVLDHSLPGMDGLTFLQELRKESEWTDVPVVFLTGMPLGDAEQFVSRAGGNVRLVTKPADPELLLSTLSDTGS